MQTGVKRIFIVSIVGFLLGAVVSAWQGKLATSHTTANSATPSVSERTTKLPKNEGINAAVNLARQLPDADAAKCAALAQSMLGQRIMVAVDQDPFTEEKAPVQYEESRLPLPIWAGLMKRWMQVDPQAAWDFAQKHHHEELPLRSVALRQWAMIDPLAAVKAAGPPISPDEQNEILEACCTSNQLVGLNLILEWNANRVAGDESSQESRRFAGNMSQLLRSLAESSPTAALQWCQSHEPDFLEDVCFGWMKRSPSACITWMAELPIDEQVSILDSIAEEGIASEKVLRRLAEICVPEDFPSHLRYNLSHLAKQDVHKAQTLIDELIKSPADRIEIRTEVAGELNDADPRKAMEFVMPSLREGLPIYEYPNNPPIQMRGGAGYRGLDYGEIVYIFGSYLELATAGVVHQTDVQKLLHEIHPQFYSLIMTDSFDKLSQNLGDPVEWLPPFAEKMSREDVRDLVEYIDSDAFAYDVAQIEALSPGSFRDALAERAFALMLSQDVPVTEVIAKAEEWSGDLQWSGIYELWLDEAPTEVLQHLISRPQANEDEWDTVIHRLYADHGDAVENAVVAMPAGALRDAAVNSLSFIACYKGNDVVTAMYWATEIHQRMERQSRMQDLWGNWQDSASSSDPQIIQGVRQNIEHSSMDARDKALWLERLESEVLR